MAGGTVILFSRQLQSISLEQAQTIAFCTIVSFQWFNALNARFTHRSLFEVGFFNNRWLLVGLSVAILLQILVVYAPPLQRLLHTVPLEAYQWGIAIGVASTAFFAEEIRKAVVPGLFDKGK
jgi:Ca2+-transporting ATPase